MWAITVSVGRCSGGPFLKLCRNTMAVSIRAKLILPADPNSFEASARFCIHGGHLVNI